MTHSSQSFSAAPVLSVHGTYNFRSVAGYPAGAGSIRAGSLFRSDALHRLSDLGERQLIEQGVIRIVDLRDSTELRQAPSALTSDGIEIVHQPIFEGAALPREGRAPSLEQIYRLIVTERVGELAGAVRLIADAPTGGVLVHCTAGKDRTGVVVATVLSAVGVPRAQVLADYAASADNLAGEWVERTLSAYLDRSSGGVIDESVRSLVASSPAEALDEALELVEQIYGGVEPMLLANGVDGATLDRLRHRLVS